MRTVHLAHDYKASPDRVWALATDFDALQDVMRGLIAFEGLPSGRARTGQKLTVMVSLFGKLPAQPYAMDVLECDDKARVLRSSERGAGVRSWRHTMRVEPTETGCCLTDRIDIDAGWLTPAFALWAKCLYGRRHERRLQLLESGRF